VEIAVVVVATWLLHGLITGSLFGRFMTRRRSLARVLSVLRGDAIVSLGRIVGVPCG
jgi:hypothetical protein